MPPGEGYLEVHVGRKRAGGDEFRRFMPLKMTFDTRSMLLKTEISEDWEPHIQDQWRVNRGHVIEGILHEHGVADYSQKVQSTADLGPAPWSVVARHNLYLGQIRKSFVSGSYYPALLGACGLGERILNQLLLTLRDDFVEHPATKRIATKGSVDDWKVAAKTLLAWKVIDKDCNSRFESLRKLRNDAIHYRSGLDDTDARSEALIAIQRLQEVIETIFAPHGVAEHFISRESGRSFIAIEAESLPLLKHFFLPSCVLVSPAYRLVGDPISGEFVAFDVQEWSGERQLSDADFVSELARNGSA